MVSAYEGTYIQIAIFLLAFDVGFCAWSTGLHDQKKFRFKGVLHRNGQKPIIQTYNMLLIHLHSYFTFVQPALHLFLSSFCKTHRFF